MAAPTAEDDSYRPWMWHRIMFFVIMHVGAVYGVYLAVTVAKWTTIIWCVFYLIVSGLSITAGAHRLWSHRSYTAHPVLRFVLMIANCIALQSDIISWSITHRCHHKWSDTPADPHDATQGFWFSHMGWILHDKSGLRAKREAEVRTDDLFADKILVFQKRYYGVLCMIWCMLIPPLSAIQYGGEQRHVAVFVVVCFRYMWMQHVTWTVNSLAHLWGNRPYDRSIQPRQNIISTLLTMGEGWHNFHHVFPTDYRASEFGLRINLTTAFIDFCAWLVKIGLVTDRKWVKQSDIDQRKANTSRLMESHPRS